MSIVFINKYTRFCFIKATPFSGLTLVLLNKIVQNHGFKVKRCLVVA